MSDTKMIALNEIAVPNRLRAVREESVNALVQSMADQGQLQPIVVRRDSGDGYCLVAGLHRLEAARKLNWKEIWCSVFDDMDADRAELVEIDENLIRANLTPAEEAAHMGRRKQLYERLHPETKHGAVGRRGKRSQNATSSEPADAFIDDIAKKTGKHRATVARKTARAKKVAVLSEVVGTCLDNGAELDALSKLPEAEQRSLAEAAKRGEQVSAITTVNAPADPKMNDVMGEVRSTPSGRKKAAPVPKLDPLAWTMSTVEDRIDFINAIGRRDIEDVLDAIEPTSTVQEAEATRSVMAHEPAEPGPVIPEKFETPNTMRGEGGFDPLFQNEVRRTTPEIVPEHMERNTNPQEAVTPLETQNTVRGEGGYDCKLDSRFQKEVRRTTPEIVPQGLPNPQEETNGERYVPHWHEVSVVRRAR